MKMTLHECKEEIAQQLIAARIDRPNFEAGYSWWSWKQYCYPSTKELEEALDRVAELYANQFKKGVGQKEAFTLEDLEAAFIAGRSKTSWNQFKKDHGITEGGSNG